MAAPYYPGMTTTPNLGLSLIGMDEVTAEDFVILDAFAGGVSGSIEINGSVVENPNFVDSATVTFSVLGSNISLTAVGGGGSGSGLNIPTAGTTSPTPVFPNPEAPSTINSAIYVEDVNEAWHQMAGIDTTTVMSSNRGIDGNPTNPQGVLTWDRMTFFRDTQSSVQSGKNASLSFNHLAGVGTSYNNQDRAIWVGMGNLTASVFQFSIDSSNNVTLYLESLTTGFAAENAIGFRVNQRIQVSGLSIGTYLNSVALSVTSAAAISGGQQVLVCSDAGFTHTAVSLTSDTGTINQLLYSMANVQMEQDVIGAPVFVSAVDGEVSTLSVQMSDQHIGLVAAPNYGCNAIRAQFYREAGTGTWGSVHPCCIRSIVTDNNNGSFGADTVTNIYVQGTAQPGNNDLYYSIYIPVPTTRFGGGTNGLVIENFGANTSDYSLRVLGGQTSLAGTVSLGTLASVAAWPVTPAAQVLAGPATGSAAAATFRVLANTDIPAFTGDSGSGGTTGGVPAPGAGDAAAGKFLSAAGTWSVPSGGGGGSVAWSSITSAAAGLTLSNGANATEFDQTSNVIWLWKNTTAGTNTTTNASPLLELAANYNSGTSGSPVSSQDTWSLGTSLAAGPNGISTLTVAHSGSTGAPQISLPTPLSFGVSSPQIIGPSGASVGVSIGGNAGLPFVVATTGASSDIMRGYQGGTFQGSITSQSTSGSFGLYSQPTAGTAELGNVGSPSATHVNPLVSLGHGGTTWATTGAGPYVGVNIGATVALGGSNSLHLNWAPTAGSGNFYALQIAPTVNQTSSASGSYTGLRIAVTETALLGTANKLIDLYAGSAGTTEVFAVDNTGKVANYAGVATVKSGVPSLVASVSLTGQVAAIVASTIYAVPAGKAGLYRISYSATITTAGTSSVLGGTNGFQSVYTSNVDGQAKTSIPTTPVISAANTTGTEISGVVCAYAQASTNLQFNFGYSSTGTAMVYAIEAYVEYLG